MRGQADSMQQRVSDVAVLHQLQRYLVPSSVQKAYSGTEWQQCSTPWRIYCMQVCLTDVLPGHAEVCTRTCTTPHNYSTSSCPGVFTPTFCHGTHLAPTPSYLCHVLCPPSPNYTTSTWCPSPSLVLPFFPSFPLSLLPQPLFQGILQVPGLQGLLQQL